MLLRNKKGRRAAKFRTIAKTYMFFEEDIDKMIRNGWTPKELLRLGIYAKENNPQIGSRVRDVESQNERVVKRLESTSRRLYELQSELDRLKAEKGN